MTKRSHRIVNRFLAAGLVALVAVVPACGGELSGMSSGSVGTNGWNSTLLPTST